MRIENTKLFNIQYKLKTLLSDQICLPRDKCDLTFLEIIPGSGIKFPDDDEDWESSGFIRFFKHGFKNIMVGLLGNATFFPHGDEAAYFDSDEEASEMVKMHFPGDGLNKTERFCFTKIYC